ncbi:MAG: hypothetical protein V1861_05470 [Candidatus Micrarchaeota archaeon]
MAPEKKKLQHLSIRVGKGTKEHLKSDIERKQEALKMTFQGFPPLEGKLIPLDDTPDRKMIYDRMYRAVEAQTDDIQSGDHKKENAEYRERKAAVIRDLMQRIGPNIGIFTLIEEGTDEATGIGKDFRSWLIAEALDEFILKLRQMQIVEALRPTPLRPMLEGFLREAALEQTGKPVEELNDVEFYRVLRNFVVGKASEKTPTE